MRKLLTIAITGLLVTALQPPATGAESASAVIGYVETYSGQAKQFAIIRDGDPVQDGVEIWAELLEWDQIQVRQAGQTLTVRFSNGSRETFGPEAGDSRSLIRKGKASTFLGNLFASLSGVFTDLQEHRVEVVGTYIKGAGEPLALDPLFSSGDTVLIEGRRNLHIAWSAGASPYSVTITVEGVDTPVFHIADVKAQEYEVEQIDLSPGVYHVEIADAVGSVAFTLQVVASQYRPDQLSSCAVASLDEALRAVTQAYCLASMEDGQWAFEAYHILMPVANSGYPPAELLLAGLRAGEYRYWALPDPEVR